MYETERAELRDALRQGDIIRLEHQVGLGNLPDLGAIINADCDLAQGKLDGVIAYLPIYTFRGYLEKFWAPRFLARQQNTLVRHVSVLCDLDDRAEIDLLQWLSTLSTTSEISEITRRLAKTCNLNVKHTTELNDKLEMLGACVGRRLEALPIFSAFCRRQKNPQQFARGQILDAKKNMGDGHFFISEIIGEADVGFVIRMRRIYTIDAGSCFTSQAAHLASTTGDDYTAVRIARLAPTFRFKLAQLFAYQFSRIGLPDEAAELSSLAIEDMVMQLSGDSK